MLAGGNRPRYGEGCAAILTATYSSRSRSEVQIVSVTLVTPVTLAPGTEWAQLSPPDLSTDRGALPKSLR